MATQNKIPLLLVILCESVSLNFPLKNFRTSFQDTDAFGAKMLEAYLKSITALSTIVVVFGYHYSDVLLAVYGGNTLSSGIAPTLMRAYWFYVLFLAVNGVTEAFVFSAMNKTEVDQ